MDSISFGSSNRRVQPSFCVQQCKVLAHPWVKMSSWIFRKGVFSQCILNPALLRERELL